MKILQIPAFTDNYFWLLHEENDRRAVIIDPGDSVPVIKKLNDYNLELTDILITHHHDDHIGGVSELLKIYPDINIYGPSDPRIPVNHVLKE